MNESTINESQQHILTLPYEYITKLFSSPENKLEQYVENCELTNNVIWKQLSSSTQKVLKIDNAFGTINDSLKLFSNRDFSESFSRAPYLFIIIIKIEGSLSKIETDLIESFPYDKPLIISFESKLDDCATIIYKETNDCEFFEIQECEKITETDFLAQLREGFSFKLLIQALKSNVGGAFNGKLIETSINTEKNFNLWRLIDYAASRNNILCLRFLDLFNFDLTKANGENKRTLEIAAQYCDCQSFSALLDLPINSDFDDFYMSPESFELLSLRNANFYSLLMIASKHGNNEVIDRLIAFEKFINEYGLDGETAASLAWKNKHFDILAKLITANSLFPCDFDQKFNLHLKHNSGKMKKLSETVEKLEKLFKEIENKNINEIEKLLNDNQDMKFTYNTRNQYSQIIAIQHEEFEIFALLKSSQGNLYAEASDEIKALIESLTDDQKYKLRDAYKKYHIASEDSYLLELFNKARLGLNHNSNDGIPYFKLIRQAFDELNEIVWIQPILKVVANAAKSDIIFDFNHDSVEDLDPTQNQYTMGIAYYNSGYIYVGAKSLLNDETKFETLGVLAHELMHYAMQLTYANKCKPFEANDKVSCGKFQEIIEIYQNSQFEPQISIVYEYPLEFWAAELIVRVPHLMALYKNDQKRYLKIKQTFGLIFKFFQEKTLIDLKLQIEKQIIAQKLEDENKDQKMRALKKEHSDSDSDDSDKATIKIPTLKAVGNGIGDTAKKFYSSEASHAVETAVDQVTDIIDHVPQVCKAVKVQIDSVLNQVPQAVEAANKQIDNAKEHVEEVSKKVSTFFKKLF